MRTQWVVMGVVLFVSLFGEGQDAMFRGNVRHRGIYEAAGVPKFSKMKWSFHTGGMVIGSPTVTGGMVYVGSDDGNFYAIDQGTGAQKWKFAAKSRVSSTPAVVGGMVYFMAYDGNLYAPDSASGLMKWKFQTGGSGDLRRSICMECSP